jgi:heme/copper-type cytochrome/quinol oxidase subunit 4
LFSFPTDTLKRDKGSTDEIDKVVKSCVKKCFVRGTFEVFRVHIVLTLLACCQVVTGRELATNEGKEGSRSSRVVIGFVLGVVFTYYARRIILYQWYFGATVSTLPRNPEDKICLNLHSNQEDTCRVHVLGEIIENGDESMLEEDDLDIFYPLEA